MVVGAGLAPAPINRQPQGLTGATAGDNRATERVAPTKKRNLQMDEPKYNPKIHHRRSIRLKGYDYSQSGLYFITICCQDMICRFGKIVNGEMVLNELGMIAYNEWLKLPERFPNFELDLFQIMPNHIHGIVALVGRPLRVPNAQGQGQVLPLQRRRWVILWVPTNHWHQIIV